MADNQINRDDLISQYIEKYQHEFDKKYQLQFPEMVASGDYYETHHFEATVLEYAIAMVDRDLQSLEDDIAQEKAD